MLHKVKAIFATGKYGEFGNGNDLPWVHSDADLNVFKQITNDSVLLMTSGTFKSLPKKLKGRPHIVVTSKLCSDEFNNSCVSKNGDSPDNIYFSDFSDSTVLLSTLMCIKEYYKKDIVIIGGKELIKHCIEGGIVDEVFHNQFDNEDRFNADKYFSPNFGKYWLHNFSVDYCHGNKCMIHINTYSKEEVYR